MDGASCEPTRSKRVRGERQRLQDAQWRQLKKNERQQLKDTALQLEAQLAQLRQDSSAYPAAGPVHGAERRKSYCAWQEKAETLRQERIQAEMLNVTFRKAVAKEQRVAMSLRALMDKRPHIQRSVVYDMRRRASGPQAETYPPVPQCSPCCNPTTLHVNPAAVRHEIEATLQRMHAHARSVLSSSVSDDSLSFNVNVWRNPASGPTTEMTSTTPMNCALDQAVKLLGANFQTQGSVNIGQSRYTQEPRRRGAGEQERRFTVELGAPNRTVLLDGFGATQRSDDENYRLILWAAISFDRCGALCFRECTWLAVHRSHSNPTSETVLRSHYSVAAEKAVDCAALLSSTTSSKC